MVSDRVKQIPSSAIHEMTQLAKTVPNSVSLSWAKPTSGTPDHINKAACEAIEKGLVSGYSPSSGLPELRQAIVEKLKKDNKIDADADEVIVTVGAIEGLSAAVMALVDPGDEVLMPSPNYSTHAQQIMLASGKPVWIPTIEEEGFKLDLDAFRKSITDKTKAVMFCSPCNPSGAVYSEKQLRGLVDISLEHNLAFITDEAYEYFVFDDAKHFCVASIPEVKENSVSTFTLTKTYAMTGWRIGYAVVSREMTSQLQKAHIPFAICAPVVSQYAALEAITGSQDCVEEFRQEYLSLRNLMCKRLDELNSIFSYQKPKGSYCIFPKLLKENDSFAFAKKLLLEVGVSTTPGAPFGPTGEGHVRMTFCCSHEDVNEAFDRMDKYFM